MLGPFEVAGATGPLSFEAGQGRLLLAILVLYRNERFSTDRLVDLMWEGEPPESAPKMVQIYVSRLRRKLSAVGADDRLQTQTNGYRIHVDPGELDLDRFEQLVQDGKRAGVGAPERAAEKFREALSLWRGPALADVGDNRFLDRERARLDELRVAAVEDRIDAELALGAGSELVDELQALTREHPQRERPVAQLMLALYRAGRQAEALETYKDARNRLVDNFGIEPGRPLKELQQAILRQDPALEPPKKQRVPETLDTPEAGTPRTRLTQRNVGIATAAVIAAAAAAAVAFALTGGESAPPITLVADSVGRIRDGGLVAASPIGVSPTAVAARGDQIWVAGGAGANSVSRLDPETLEVRQTIPVGSGPNGVAIGGGAVWVTNGLDGTLSRIDPKANRVVQTIQVGNGPAAVAYGLGSVWVANRSDQTVSGIDPKTGDVVDTLAAGTDAGAIAAGFGSVWVVDEARGRIARLEPGFSEPSFTINVGNGASAVALGSRSIWVANTLDSTVSQIDPRSNRVTATVPVGAGPVGVAVAADDVWTANAFDETLSRISPPANRVQTVRLGQRPEGVVASGEDAYVAVGPSPATHRGGTLRLVVQQFPFDSIDPSNTGAWPALIATNDGLTAYRRVGGAEGLQLVPDLALALPTPTDGGKTYTFRVRRGIHYSNGQLVRPEDFRRALERSIGMFHDPSNYGALAGSSACASHGHRCRLSHGVVPNDRTWTVTFHLAEPDPDFLYKLALPAAYAVPAGTPSRDVGRRPAPATGAYRITSYVPHRLVRLERNPRFRPWSPDAQPLGFPDQIVWRLDTPPAAQVRAVDAGRADVVTEGVPPNRLEEVKTQHASQIRENVLAGTTFLFLNTHLPPFDDVRVRRAVSYAVDRAAIVRALGGTDRAQVTCQILPPNFPAYRPYCPFTLHASPSGNWVAPNLKKARQLVAASGARGAKVVVWLPPNHRAEGRIVVRALAELGFRARGQKLGFDYYPKIGNSRLKVQAGVHAWLPDYRAPAAFLDTLFSCRAFKPGTGRNLNASQFCDHRIDRQMSRASELEVTDPALANSLWSRVDRGLTDQAPIVPLVTPKQVDFVSPRVGNYQYHPQWHVLVDQLWVR